MSFSIDLWNGANIIKDKYLSIRRQFRLFANFITKYNTYEIQHCKNLDSLYNEFREKNTKPESDFEKARINLIETINFESQTRKVFLNDISNITKKINSFLQDWKNQSNEINELNENFERDLLKLKEKKDAFYNQCKEMSSLISQLELENKLNDKSNEQRLNKILSKLIKSRDEYLININEANIKRNSYNNKVEEIMNKYENQYKNVLKEFLHNLIEIKNKKYEMIEALFTSEKNDFVKLFSKLNLDNEFINFLIQNATKEFPMVEIQFCPFKKKEFETFLNLKYHKSLKQNELNRIMTSINNYFENQQIFPLNFIQTGISKVVKPQRENFFNTRKFSIFIKKNIIGNENADSKKNENDKSSNEKEIEIINNYEFIKNVVNELVNNNKIQIFKSKYVVEGDISKFKDEKKNLDNINDKVEEMKKLLDEKTESHLVYIEALIKTLSYLRSRGCFEIKGEAFDVFAYLFLVILEQNSNNDYILKNIILLAQTFYKTENNEKIYIQENIKGNQIFNEPKTWHRCINYSLKIVNKDLDANNRKEYINKINKDAIATVITYLCDLKAFTDDETVYNKVSYFYSKLYNIDESNIKLNVENSIKSRLGQKEKVKKKKELKDKDKMEKKDLTSLPNENKNEIIIEEKNKTQNENKNEIKENEIKSNNNIYNNQIQTEQNNKIEEANKIDNNTMINNNEKNNETNNNGNNISIKDNGEKK